MSTLEGYPKWVDCRHELKVLIRPLEKRDIHTLVNMLHALDASDRCRLPCDVNDPGYPERLQQEIEHQTVYRLVAWIGNEQILGSLALYPGSVRWFDHTARVVLVTHPDYRRYGVATVLFDEVIPLAESLGVRKLFTEVTDLHKEAIRLARMLGMKREANLTDHMKDSEGRFHNLYIYAMTLKTAQEKLAERLAATDQFAHKI